MSTAEFARKVVSIVHQSSDSPVHALDFQLAYQARVAADRIRFAICQIDESARSSDQLREASIQLLDALDRLQSAERDFQSRFHDTTDVGKRAVVSAAKLYSDKND